jgi:transposase
MVAANARTAIAFALSPGQASDAVEGRKLQGRLGPLPAPLHLVMDGAYEDNQTLQLALDFGFIPVVPPRSNRLEPWQYDKAMYRRRNEIERLFRRLKGFRRIFSRFDKLDVVFLAFLYFALIVEALRLNSVNTPYIGWELFRQDPHWHWPLTYTDRVGYPVGENVALLDPNPLLICFA